MAKRRSNRKQKSLNGNRGRVRKNYPSQSYRLPREKPTGVKMMVGEKRYSIPLTIKTSADRLAGLPQPSQLYKTRPMVLYGPRPQTPLNRPDTLALNVIRSTFDMPPRASVCENRKKRREIIHAMGYAGKNGFRVYKLNPDKRRCK